MKKVDVDGTILEFKDELTLGDVIEMKKTKFEIDEEQALFLLERSCLNAPSNDYFKNLPISKIVIINNELFPEQTEEEKKKNS